jgi:uncharacterized RDD family membrane protein YckC
MMDRAGFYPRVAAFLCDLLLFFVVVHAAALVDTHAYLASTYNDFGVISGGVAGLFVIGLAMFEVLGIGSPGKRFMRLMIAADDGAPASRRMLLSRVAVKYMPALLVSFPAVLFALTDPYGPQLPAVVQYGLTIIGTIGAVLAVGAMLLVTGGCFRALRPDARAMHDMAAGTAVFFRPHGSVRGFTPIIPTPVVSIPEKTAGGEKPGDASDADLTGLDGTA